MNADSGAPACGGRAVVAAPPSPSVSAVPASIPSAEELFGIAIDISLSQETRLRMLQEMLCVTVAACRERAV